MEVGDHCLDDAVVVARGDDDLRAGVQRLHAVAIQVGDDGLQGIGGRDGGGFGRHFVGLPLPDVQFLFGGVGTIQQGDADVVEALQCAHGGGAHGDGASFMGYQPFQRVARHGDVLRVHLVPFNLFAFHGFEGAGTHVQRQFFQLHALLAQSVEHARGEVQPGGGGGYRPFYLGVDRLVGLLVALLRLAVQVGRDGQFAEHFQDVGKGDFGIVPAEVHPVAGAVAGAPFGGQGERASFYGHLPLQCALFPLLQVAHHAEPRRVFGLLEVQCVVVGGDRLQAEHLNQCPCLLAEVQACLDDFGVVEYHQAAGRQMVGQGGETVFAHLAVAVEQQFGLVAHGQRVFGDAFVGQRVVELADADVSGVFFHEALLFYCIGCKVTDIWEDWKKMGNNS